MDIDAITDYCLGKIATHQEIKFENLLCFCVDGKIFFGISLDDTPLRATAKVGEASFDAWLEKPGFMQAPYFAKRQWITSLHIENLSESECKELIDTSYTLITSKLTLKRKKELGLE